MTDNNGGKKAMQQATVTAAKPKAPPVAPELPELPEDRKAAVAAAVEYHQTAHQLALTRIDELQKENIAQRGDVAGYKIALDAKDAQLNEEKSKTETAMLIRDQAVAKCTKLESALTSMMAIGRAHEIENAPVISDGSDTDDQPAEAQS